MVFEPTGAARRRRMKLSSWMTRCYCSLWAFAVSAAVMLQKGFRAWVLNEMGGSNVESQCFTTLCDLQRAHPSQRRDQLIVEFRFAFACQNDAWCWFTVSHCVTLALLTCAVRRGCDASLLVCVVASARCARWLSSFEALLAGVQHAWGSHFAFGARKSRFLEPQNGDVRAHFGVPIDLVWPFGLSCSNLERIGSSVSVQRPWSEGKQWRSLLWSRTKWLEWLRWDLTVELGTQRLRREGKW